MTGLVEINDCSDCDGKPFLKNMKARITKNIAMNRLDFCSVDVLRNGCRSVVDISISQTFTTKKPQKSTRESCSVSCGTFRASR